MGENLDSCEEIAESRSSDKVDLVVWDYSVSVNSLAQDDIDVLIGLEEDGEDDL